MVEFGHLVNDTEQIFDTVNPSEKIRLYAIYNNAIANNEKRKTKNRKQLNDNTSAYQTAQNYGRDR